MSLNPLHLLLITTFIIIIISPYIAISGPITDPVTVPSLPVQPDPTTCHLDLSSELFGGVAEACGRTLDRSRCCPVLAAWLFAAHARSALQLTTNTSSASSSDLMPMMPDDSQKCVNSLQSSLLKRKIRIPQPNATCDAVLCFCGIRLHQISSLRCPAAFNVTTAAGKDAKGNVVATPSAAVKGLEKSCRNSSYSGCSKCLGALQKIKGEDKSGAGGGDSRGSKMLNRDCQLMGLTWLLARNKSAFIPTVSAVLRAIMYSAHPSLGGGTTTTTTTTTTCSPDQENMPLAVDSLQFQKSDPDSSSSSSSSSSISLQRPGSFRLLDTGLPILPLVMFGILGWVMG